MKAINLISLVHAYRGMSKPLYERYFSHFKIDPKENEIIDLGSLVEQLQLNSSDSSIFEKYFFGYKIPQISKEFDLLRFCENFVVNIELKSENTGSKIYKQLIRNKYYLSFLKKKTFCFTYVTSEKRLYTLNEDNILTPVGFNVLTDILSAQETIEISNIDNLFNPSNYLVSPFNSTEEFMESKYFLTAQQEEIKLDCIRNLKIKGTTFLSICGKAGTGKTLLTFDIAKELISESNKVLIIHCGNLNAGHIKLRDTYHWDVIPIKFWDTRNLSDYYLIIIDETQRIFPGQLESIITKIKLNGGNCIFSYDMQQCLRTWETNNNISQLINEKTSSKIYQLTEKIRTNKEIASFILALFDKSKPVEKLNRDNINLCYFGNFEDAKKYINVIGEQGWKIINYTPSNRHNYPYDNYSVAFEDNAHGVIGQEYDKVIAVIDHCFYYEGNDLAIRGYVNAPYYNPVKMLFQIVTRTRLKLCVVVINNDEIMDKCMSILN